MLDEDIRAPGWRLGALALVVFAALGVLLNRLWTVQIVNNESAKQRAEEQTTVKARIAPARGTICDRNGIALAENRPSFDIDLYLDDLRRDYAEGHRGRVPQIPPDGMDAVEAAGRMLAQLGDRADPDGKAAVAAAVRQVREDLAQDDAEDLARSVSTLRRAAFRLAPDLYRQALASGRKHYPEINIVAIVRESLAPITQTLGLSVPLNAKEIKEHFRTERDLPYHYLTDLDFTTVAQFAERNLGLTGIKIAQNPQRQYTYGAFASHILGYVGRPRNQNEHLASDGTPYETVGLHGIEGMMDAQLQGEPGNMVQRVTAGGYLIGDKPISQSDPTVGKTVYLAMDARVQYIVETAVRHSPYTRAAVVVMDPRNGDVLALASFPDYDPNKFIPRISSKDWDALNNDPTAPLFNRALHSFVPGSTYKILVALAGLKSGRVTAKQEIPAPGAIQIGDHLFHDSTRRDHGDLALHDAIRISSDTYFYQYGIKTGIENIDAMAKLAGLGHKWGLLGEGDEDAGTVPGPEWMKENSAWLLKTHNVDRWSDAQTANTSIGQGFVQVTPLQMTAFLCAVANGGTVYQPRLYAQVKDYQGEVQAEIPAGQVFDTLGVKPADMKTVQEGMLAVVEEDGGTAHGTVPVEGHKLAGKTGTAQAYRRVDGVRKEDDQTWFYCYGPYEKPRYAVTVMVEGGDWGASAAGPIAHEIMSRLFAMDAGAAQEQVAFLPPLQGNFYGVKDPTVHEEDKPKGDEETDPPTDAPPAPAAPAGGPSPQSTKRAR